MSAISDDEIKNTIEGAFRPLRCAVKIWDYGRKLKFRVFDSQDNGVLRVEHPSLDLLRSDSELKSVISQARKAVKEKGFALEPWTFPK